jgi:MoxR-like ATPase
MIELVQREVRKIIIGKNDVISKVLMAILAAGHVLLDDVPGVGKTTLTLAFAKALGLETKRVQFTSDSVPSDIIGFSMYDKRVDDFVYKPGAIMTNMLLADEINRTSSKTQSALLEAMEEGNVTVDGVTRQLPSPFVVLATQNPVGAAGTQMLPNSQLDRFLIRISIGYPDLESQVSIMKDRHRENPLTGISQIIGREQLLAIIDEVTGIFISDTIYDYIARLVHATRENPMVQLGVSPRGGLAVCRMAKARAYLSGRDYMIPEDVVDVFPDVCAHRLVLNAKARFSEMSEHDILSGLLSEVKMPILKEIN